MIGQHLRQPGPEYPPAFPLRFLVQSASRSFHTTVVVALLQPPPEVGRARLRLGVVLGRDFVATASMGLSNSKGRRPVRRTEGSDVHLGSGHRTRERFCLRLRNVHRRYFGAGLLRRNRWVDDHSSRIPPPVHNGVATVSNADAVSQTYRLFDNIILMAEGKTIFNGPREDVVPYFNSLG